MGLATPCSHRCLCHLVFIITWDAQQPVKLGAPSVLTSPVTPLSSVWHLLCCSYQSCSSSISIQGLGFQQVLVQHQ